jgi:hypothetical protein
MKTDLSCPRCGQFVGRGGITPLLVANCTAFFFAFLMVVFLVTVAIPRTQGSKANDLKSIIVDNLATNVANYVFILGALIVGWVVGRVAGAVFCRVG